MRPPLLALVLTVGLLLSSCLAERDPCACSLARTPGTDVFVLSGPGPESRLETVGVAAPGLRRDAGRAAVRALLRWRPDVESGQRNGWHVLSEPIARVRSVTHADGVVRVDLDRQVWDPHPALDLVWAPDGERAWQQLVWTVSSALDTHDPVELTVRGMPARGVWFHRLDGPVAADPGLLGPARGEDAGHA